MVFELCNCLKMRNRNRLHFKVCSHLQSCLSLFPICMPPVYILTNSETSTHNKSLNYPDLPFQRISLRKASAQIHSCWYPQEDCLNLLAMPPTGLLGRMGRTAVYILKKKRHKEKVNKLSNRDNVCKAT